ncbi:MAG: hypothetical protein WBP45_07375 [Daejeonella sp.]
MNYKQLFFRAGVTLATLFFALINFMSLSEWWKVGIRKDISAYPWGHIADNPWYYDNPSLYSTVMLSEGLLMLVFLALAVWFIVQKQKTRIAYSLLACTGVFVLMLISAEIQ